MIGRSFHRHDVRCAAEGCDARIGRGQLFCKGHYFSLPDALRSRLWATWRAAMNARRGTTTIAQQAEANSAYHEAYLACLDHLRAAPVTPAEAMTTVAIAASGEAVTYVGGRML